MTITTMKPDSLQPAAEMAVDLFDNWLDPLETEVRARAREFIEELIRGELDIALARPRYSRSQMASNEGRADIAGHRHGSRTRSLTGTFGPIEIAVPRARLNTPEGKTTEWKSQALRAYQRRTLTVDALIASTYLAGTNTRRVRHVHSLLCLAVRWSKDTVSRTWRKVKSDWDAPGTPARWPKSRLYGSFSTARIGARAARPQGDFHPRCWSSSVCARTAKRSCSRSRAWGERAPKLGAPSSTISSRAACVGPRISHRRWRAWARQGDSSRMGRRAGAALHGP